MSASDSVFFSYVVVGKRDKGFSLIEALVAVLVLGFGVLAVSALHLKSLQSSHVSYQRTLATLAGQDMVERLWVEMALTPPDCPSGAVLDNAVAAWYMQWSGFLPSLKADAVTRLDCNYTILVEWVDSRFSSETVSSLVYEANLIGEVP